MINATWVGIAFRSSPSGTWILGSDFKDLLFLGGKDVVQFLDGSVGELLNLFLGFEAVVFGYISLFLEILEHFVGIPADISDGHLEFLTGFGHAFYDLFPALLGQRRDGNANQLIV